MRLKGKVTLTVTLTVRVCSTVRWTLTVTLTLECNVTMKVTLTLIGSQEDTYRVELQSRTAE